VEVGHHETALLGVIARGVDQTGGGVREPAVVGTTGQSRVGRLVTQQGHRGTCLAQRLAQVVHHLGGSVLQPVQDAHHPGGDVIVASRTARQGVPGELEKEIAFLQ
jgi:hypothetical protein